MKIFGTPYGCGSGVELRRHQPVGVELPVEVSRVPSLQVVQIALQRSDELPHPAGRWLHGMPNALDVRLHLGAQGRG
jgi:hypothetical protein